MTRFLLIRHASYPMIARGLGGRAPHGLDATGLIQAQRMAEHLRGWDVAAVIASPVRRAVETAQPSARGLGLPLELEPGFAEIDFGAWTGAAYASLDGQPAWQAWNVFRSTAAVPDGEAMLSVQSRAVSALRRLGSAHGQATVAVFSHGDVIKAMLAHFLGAPLDLIHRIEIDPASISQVELHEQGAKIRGLNQPV